MLETTAPISSPSTLGSDPDASAVAAWVNGADPAAFARLVALHHGYVHRVALSVLGPACEADAEDVVQEVFLRVAGRLRDFRYESRFRTWLHRLTLNVALDYRRRPRFRKPHLDDSVLDDRPAPEGAWDPFVSADAGERARALCTCLEALPDSLRAVIHLRYWLDLSMEEVAATLQVPLGTVKSHLHRGRELLFRAMVAKGFHLAGERGTGAAAGCSRARLLARGVAAAAL